MELVTISAFQLSVQKLLLNFLSAVFFAICVLLLLSEMIFS